MATKKKQFVLTLALLITASVPEFSANASDVRVRTVRGASNTDINSLESVVGVNTVIDLNPNATSVWSEPGFTTTSRIVADGTRGEVRGFAQIDLPDPFQTPWTPMGGAGGGMRTEFVLTGPTSPGTVTLEFAFDGVFSVTRGKPLLSLEGIVAGGVGMDINASSLNIRQGFDTTGYDYIGSSATADGGTDYPGASYEVFSLTADRVAGVARLRFDALPGDVVSVDIFLLGVAAGDFAGNGSWRSSAGSVDFLNTGTLRVVLPQGYGYEGESPLLAAVVTQVPEPARFSSLALGLFLLSFTVWRRKTMRWSALERRSRNLRS